MRTTAILIGPPALCDTLERQLALLPEAPILLGRVHVGHADAPGAGAPVLGTLEQLETVCASRTPSLALVTLPAPMSELLLSIRTRLRKLGVADRFMPSLEDQIAGVGPRTEIDIDLQRLIGRPPRWIDEDAIRAADHVIDMGPGAGVHGGNVVAQGSPADIVANENSLTGRYLAGSLCIEVPQRRVPRGDRVLRITGASGNNLRSVDTEIPLGLLVCVTGVSGSGKSTLVNDTLHNAVARHLYGSQAEPAPHEAIEGLEHLDKVIAVDQSPIGRTPRSNPATYTGLFTPIRDLYAETPTARERGYGPGRFSFNVKGGRCETCEGDGVIKVEMHFLPDLYVSCDTCHGKRYNRETLEVLYKGRNIAEVLEMTIEQAHTFFANVPLIARKLHTLLEVGLGYVRLGQSATTLSGGEAQRVKLSQELSKRGTGKTLYILDEPTTGLHFHDIALLLRVIHALRDAGNTVVVIEHNLDVIKTADWVIDLGPEGGAGGGQIVAAGTPEQVAATEASHTGRYLGQALGRH